MVLVDFANLNLHFSFDPIALHLFEPLAIRWYGLMYMLAFLMFLGLGSLRIRRGSAQGWTLQQLDDLLFYGVMGVILGGRLGYVLFYKPAFYLSNPLDIIKVWEGGMAFHGGFLGVLVAMWLFARRHGKSFLQVGDFVAPLVPLGLAAGRMGNFINGELWGRVTDPAAWWAMQLPQMGTESRHPSTLYQFSLEGLSLFALLWLYSRQPRPSGRVSALFLLGYGLCRFIAEFAREPDNFLGLLSLGLSMGQWLSLPMIIAGGVMWVWAGRRST